MKHCYSRGGEHFHGPFDTLKQAVIEAVDDNSATPFNFYVGTTTGEKKASTYMDADCLLEQMSERAYDECGEVAEDFMCSIGKEPRVELDELLATVIDTWAEKHGEQPAFWHVDDIRPMTWEEAQAILSA